MPLKYIPETEEEKEELDRDFKKYAQVEEEDIEKYNKSLSFMYFSISFDRSQLYRPA